MADETTKEEKKPQRRKEINRKTELRITYTPSKRGGLSLHREFVFLDQEPPRK